MPDIRERFERNTTDPLVIGERPDHVPDAAREVDIRLPFFPGLPNGFDAKAEEQLANAHSGAAQRAREIRRLADAAWKDEPRIQGVQLSPAQRIAWKREHVKAVVAAEAEKASALLKPIVERSRKELESRRAKLVEKGTPRLEGIAAERAMRIADHFSTLPAETRSLRIIEAMNSATEPASRELLNAIAWAPDSLDLVAPETLGRVRGALIASSDPDAYASVTSFDVAIQATSESLDNLEKWGLSLADEN